MTVREDFPICSAICSCVALGLAFTNSSSSFSSKVTSKGPFWHFEESVVSLWPIEICRLRFRSSCFAPNSNLTLLELRLFHPCKFIKFCRDSENESRQRFKNIWYLYSAKYLASSASMPSPRRSRLRMVPSGPKSIICGMPRMP